MAPTAYTSYVLDPDYKAVLLKHSFDYESRNECYNDVQVYLFIYLLRTFASATHN